MHPTRIPTSREYEESLSKLSRRTVLVVVRTFIELGLLRLELSELEGLTKRQMINFVNKVIRRQHGKDNTVHAA